MKRKRSCASCTRDSCLPIDTAHVKWVTHWGVTYITMWDNEHLLRNIKFAMMMEILGIGPHKYCIVTNIIPNFEKKLMLLMAYLPRQKLCFYLPMFVLHEPFQRPPWRDWGMMVSHRQVNFKNPLVQTIYHTPAVCHLPDDGIS